MKHLMLIAVLALVAIAPSFAQKKNVIMYIGDGYGIAPKTAARLALGQGQPGSLFSTDPNFQLLATDKLKYQATVTTHSFNAFITDSAPGATCYAAGQNGKIDNDAIAWDPITQAPVETILEAAKKQGYAVGIVSTARITHATPADFASHTWSRSLEDVIAAQYLASNQAEYAAMLGEQYDSLIHWIYPQVKDGVEIDVILGGGARHFYPASVSKPVLDANGVQITDANGMPVAIPGRRRTDSRDLVEYATENFGFEFVNSRDALLNIDLDSYTADNDKKLLGLFNASHASYEQDRQLTATWEPSLADMVEIAIKVLEKKSDKGFFLMVESGRIDHMEHANVGGVIVRDNGLLGIQVDKPTFSPDVVYNFDPTAAPIDGIYGSDYLIKEVMIYDYAIAEGQKLMERGDNQTLIFQSSDHECGGLTIVGLHDAADAQGNGTLIRTYAKRPTNPLGSANARPGAIVRGDSEIGGWFPEYEMYEFQGKMFPRPAGPDARRIVIGYGSSQETNGNGAFGTPGNHTPQDVWVGADDNVGGEFARRITGRGLLDNTDLTPIMSDFMGLSDVFSTFDLSGELAITADKATVCKFENVTATITVTNNDVTAGSNIEVIVPVPAGTAFVSSSVSNGTYRIYGPGAEVINTWTIDALAPGESATLTLTVFTLADNAVTFTAETMKGADKTSGSLVVNQGNCDTNNAAPSVETLNIKTFPTPATQDVRVEYNSEMNGKAMLNVYDLNGTVVNSLSINVENGYNAIDLNVNKLAAGTYYVMVVGDNFRSEAAAITKN